MPKRIDTFVSENRTNIQRIDATFVPVSGQNNQTLTFSGNNIRVEVEIRVYTRSLNDNLVSGHPDGNTHGSGHGVAGDFRGSWSLVEDVEESDDFVQSGRNSLRDALGGSNTDYFGETAVGTGTTGAIPPDSSLESETGSAFAWGEAGSSANISVANSIFLFSEFGDSVSEYGVFSASDLLYNRITTTSVNPGDSEELRVETEFTVTGDGVGNSAITDDGEELIALTLRDSDTPVGLNEIAFGSGNAPPQESDTSLDTEEFRKNVERELSSETITAHTVVFQNEPSSQPVDIQEVGVYDNGGNLLWRTVIDQFTKNEDVEFDTFVGFSIR